VKFRVIVTTRVLLVAVLLAGSVETAGARFYSIGTVSCSGTSSPCSSYACTDIGGFEVCLVSQGVRPSSATYQGKKTPVYPDTGYHAYDLEQDYNNYVYCTEAQSCTNYEDVCLGDNCEGHSTGWSGYGGFTYDWQTVSGAQPCP
jgi:hypothetical protein